MVSGSLQVDQSYGYDLVGNLTQASDSSGRVLGFSYDALGRKTSQTDSAYAYGNASFQYDAAGNRTRFTFNDGLYVSYDYLANGAPNTIRDSAGTALVSFGYDDLGRRTSLTRSNGAVTSYSYDAASRLSQLVQNLAGTTYDLTLGFGYNPAAQITSRTSSNDNYAWRGHYNVDRSYGVNGLNQLTTAGSSAIGYDGRGNLTSSGSTSYTYNIDNQLLTMTGVSGTMVYDPLGRLSKGSLGGPTSPITALTYDGADLIAETDTGNGNLLRRYIHGPGTDEPLIWYEGAGTSDRRWHHADERGTIIAVTNDSGTLMAVNRYDESASRPTCSAGWAIPGRSGYPRWACTTIRHACTRPRSDGSCRPIPSDMAMASTGTTTSVAIRSIKAIRADWMDALRDQVPTSVLQLP